MCSDALPVARWWRCAQDSLYPQCDQTPLFSAKKKKNCLGPTINACSVIFQECLFSPICCEFSGTGKLLIHFSGFPGFPGIEFRKFH